MILATSTSDNPTNLATGWNRRLISVHRDGFQTDFPTLGLDANGIYLRVLFYNNGSPVTNAGHTIVAIKKPEVYQNPPVIIDHHFLVTNGVPIWTIQPAVNFDEIPTNGYAWFIGKGPPDLGTNYQGGELYYRRLQWIGTNASLDTNWVVVSNPSLGYRDYYDLDGTNGTIHPSSGVFAQALGGAVPLFDVGSRLATVAIRNGYLWTCHTVGLSGTNGVYNGDKFATNVDRSAIQWFRIQISSDGPSLTLSTHRRTFDAVHQTNSWWYHFASLAVNCPGDMVAGFSGSSASNYISAFYMWRLTSGTALVQPQFIQAGTTDYNPSQFGDYSATMPDPADEWSFWTVQQYATPQSFHSDRWATAIARIRARP